MSKYKRGLVEDIKVEHQEEKHQEQLRAKYNLQNKKDTIVIETSNAFKFTVKMLVGLVKTLAICILLILAFIGLVTLIYPEIRNEFFQIMKGIYSQLLVFIPFLPH